MSCVDCPRAPSNRNGRINRPAAAARSVPFFGVTKCWMLRSIDAMALPVPVMIIGLVRDVAPILFSTVSFAIALWSPLLLREFYCQLALGWRHFAPKFLQVGLDCRVFRIFAQRHGEPPIGGREVMRRA